MGANYTIVDLEQGSDEWLDWRDNVIGSSDAPTIMGENPWKSVKQLLSEKLGEVERFGGNAATRRGTALEPEARRKYEELTGNQVEPAVLQSATYPWQVASVDGLGEDGCVVVEIKCGQKAYEYAASEQEVPGHYVGQLQHILAVTGLPQIDFFCYSPGEEEVLLTVERDDEYIDRLIAAEQEFLRDLHDRMPTDKLLSSLAAGEHIRVADKSFDDISEAAEFYGVRETTIEKWIHWLKTMPADSRRDLAREIEIRGLDYKNGVIGTEEEEEERREVEKQRAKEAARRAKIHRASDDAETARIKKAVRAQLRSGQSSARILQSQLQASRGVRASNKSGKEKSMARRSAGARPSARIRIVGETFGGVGEAAGFYGVRETTIEDWLLWLQIMKPGPRNELVREIRIRKLDYKNGVIGTEEEEEERENAEKKREKEAKRQLREREREQRKRQRAREAEKAAELREKKSLSRGAAVKCPVCRWLQYSATNQVGKRKCISCRHRW